MSSEMIAGVVVASDSRRAIMFDDSPWYEFYSSQEISGPAFIELAGADALYRSIRENAVLYEV